GRAPHHDLVGLVALEELEGVIGHGACGRRVALLMVHDATAIGGPAHRDVVEAEAIEDRIHRLDHVRGAEDVAAEVEHDLVPLALRGRRGEAPRRLARHVEQIAGDGDVVEVALVVVGHVPLLSWSGTRSRLEAASARRWSRCSGGSTRHRTTGDRARRGPGSLEAPRAPPSRPRAPGGKPAPKTPPRGPPFGNGKRAAL